MKELFECEVCGRTHDSKEKAHTCETTHTIIVPKWWWCLPIPFFGFIVMTYHLFSKPNAICFYGAKPKKNATEFNLKSELYRFGITFFPIIFWLVVLIICNTMRLS